MKSSTNFVSLAFSLAFSISISLVRFISGPNGDFEGDTTVTRFYLMRPLRAVADFGRKETEAVAWATPPGARRMIEETTSAKRRARDLAVLEGRWAATFARLVADPIESRPAEVDRDEPH